MTTTAETERDPYRIMESGIDCGPVTSWAEILDAIDEAEHGDGAPQVWFETESRFLARDEIEECARDEQAE